VSIIVIHVTYDTRTYRTHSCQFRYICYVYYVSYIGVVCGIDVDVVSQYMVYMEYGV
jgi:hypothetical protein